MSETIRVRTSVPSVDTYLKVPINQDFDFIKILSLKISQSDTYPLHCSDYGVVVGRVTVNNGFGIPNAKVSIFIPLSTDDESNPVISSVYPYKTYADKNADGVRYNLLPKSRQNNCHQAVGTFPSKREVLDNNDILEIFEKYYKYTTTTNESGDYMICGVPVGTQFIHIDVDLSDIGVLSQRPYDFIRKGTVAANAFDSPTKFKMDADFNKLPQIITENSSIEVMPFWGDAEQCDIGINRHDVDLPYTIEPFAFFIGSIFSDAHKNSVNQHCRARRKVGNICETVTGEGTIEMIRKTLRGHNEYFTVDGGRNIDDDGSWILPVPMNLDYYVTDEYGNLVPSEDPAKGIPTRARVRFRIGMDMTGEESRLRTTAKFLVPNNPPIGVEGDYSFNEQTPDNNFVDMKWNNLYTVRNFIPRVQRGLLVDQRSFIGIKNVDDCETYTEFPYNRVDTQLNPLYMILTSIFILLSILVVAINLTVVPVVNLALWTVNKTIGFICKALYTITKALIEFEICISNDYVNWCSGHPFDWINGGDPLCVASVVNKPCPDQCDCMIPYVPPIILDCDELKYAPGFPTALDVSTDCGGVLPDGTDTNISHYQNCMLTSLADALNVFKFDFYNDWINGTLYSFLFKYKHKRNGKMKYCAYDCGDLFAPAQGATVGTVVGSSAGLLVGGAFGGVIIGTVGGAAGSGGLLGNGVSFPNAIDGNGDGIADNSCWPTHSFDTCAYGPVNGIQCGTLGGCEDSFSSIYKIKEGLIKWQDGTMYYASTTHNGAFKLFATDITLLGNIMENNIEGLPMIYRKLLPTTYQLPPIASNEGGELSLNLANNGGIFNENYAEDGITSLVPLLMNINAVGANLFPRHCKSVRLICEIGRGLDEHRNDVSDNIPPAVGSDRNGVIENKDIESEFIRSALRHMNVDFPYADEDSYHIAYRGFEVTTNGFGDAEGADVDVPAIPYFSNHNDDGVPNAVTAGLPYNNSYYFYFGLHVGKTSLDKLLTKYLTDCDFPPETNLYISYTATPVTTFGGSDGTLRIEVEGGISPYTATVTSNNPNAILDPSYSFQQSVIIGSALPVGTYTITVFDSTGVGTKISINIDGVDALTAYIAQTDIMINGQATGEIFVSNINGGQEPFNITLLNSALQSVATFTCPTQSCSHTFSGLLAGSYTVRITDSGTPAPQTQNFSVTLLEPTPLIGSIVYANNLTCYHSNNGQVKFAAAGGTPPHTCAITGPNNFNVSTFTANNLVAGTYTATIRDSHQQSAAPIPVVLTEPNQLTLGLASTTHNGYNISCRSGSNGNIIMTAAGGTSPYSYYLNNLFIITVPSSHTINNKIAGNYNLMVVDDHGCQASGNITLTQPPTSLSIGFNSPSAQQVKLTATGGVGGVYGQYQYSMDGGARSSMPNCGYDCVVFTATTGDHLFEIWDANDCHDYIVGTVL